MYKNYFRIFKYNVSYFYIFIQTTTREHEYNTMINLFRKLECRNLPLKSQEFSI